MTLLVAMEMLVNSLNVFLFEKSEILKFQISCALTRAGHRVQGIQFDDCTDLTRFGVRPDICIIDFQLNQKGLELLRRIRAFSSDTLIVSTASRTVTSDLIAGYRAGVDIYLPKPLDPNELVAIAKNLANRKFCANSATA